LIVLHAPSRCSESEAGVDALLDEPMMLLDDVVQIRGISTMATTAEFTGLLQLGDRAGVCRMPIYVDDPRRGTAV
jgi:hypothetical protein